MSLASDWLLEIHRAIWFVVLYALGLERTSVEVMDQRFQYTGPALVPVRNSPATQRSASKRKTA
jgi:hypothetical protein